MPLVNLDPFAKGPDCGQSRAWVMVVFQRSGQVSIPILIDQVQDGDVVETLTKFEAL